MKIRKERPLFPQLQAYLKHGKGPVENCPCAVCDTRIPDRILDNDEVELRHLWREKGLFPFETLDF